MKALVQFHHSGRLGLIGHVIADYPSPNDCRALVAAMAANGVQVIEVQIPFSEPVADGPTFAAANEEALRRGVTVASSLALIAELASSYPSVAFVCMTYANIVFARGARTFLQELGQAGAQGIIVPDWPLPCAGTEITIAAHNGIAWIPIVAPTTTEARLREILPLGSGFVYVVARTGVTGSRTAFDASIADYLQRIRAVRSDLPLAVGFGIAAPADLEALRGHADYSIVGTHALRLFREGGVEVVDRFWRAMQRCAGQNG